MKEDEKKGVKNEEKEKFWDEGEEIQMGARIWTMMIWRRDAE